MAKYPSQPLKFMHGNAEVFGQYYMHGNAEVFGQYYMHSAKARQAARKRKQINKRK